jgi:aminomuconate-semialdehyde/2-hydroxymuconate-6-semialdehyde dehydrogenase
MRELLNFIGGRTQPARDARVIDVHDPAVGVVHARVPDSGTHDVVQAVAAAQDAFPKWAATPAKDRAAILFRLADLIDRNLDALARAESIDTGKPVSLATAVDIPRSAENFRYFAGAVQHTTGEYFETDSSRGAPAPGSTSRAAGIGAINYTLRRPRGVAGLISPWNLPLYLLTWKIAPTLATGNTAVCKPSEVTPTTASMLAELSIEAGLPPGVLNIVHGRGPEAGSAIVQHPDIPAISFTGSTGVGRWIGRECGERLKRVSLELGGKNPLMIFQDADIDLAIDTAARAAFTNQGQICLCGARVLAERSIFERVLRGLIARAERLKPGDPLDPATTFGSLVSAEHLEKVAGMVDEARRDGGTIHTGGMRADPALLPDRVRRGCFYLPTVISGLSPWCRAEQEEIFGPVITLQPFDNEDEAVSLANGTKYGLAATLFTRDLSRAHRVASRLEAGIIWVNCWMLRDLRTPFGGMKQSGVGREGGMEAIKFFTEPRNICIGLHEESR